MRHARRGSAHRPHMAVRRALLEEVLAIVARDHFDQWALSHCLGMTRPRASNLLHGHLRKFNSETLIDVLARLGVTVELQVTHRQRYLRWNIRKPRPGWRAPPGTVGGIDS